MGRFMFTVLVPSRNGAPTQLVIGEHPAWDLARLCDEMESRPFIIVTQLHKPKHAQDGLEPAGETILNCEHIGKVRELQDRPGQQQYD